jgi:hypothetical protein
LNESFIPVRHCNLCSDYALSGIFGDQVPSSHLQLIAESMNVISLEAGTELYGNGASFCYTKKLTLFAKKKKTQRRIVVSHQQGRNFVRTEQRKLSPVIPSCQNNNETAFEARA